MKIKCETYTETKNRANAINEGIALTNTKSLTSQRDFQADIYYGDEDSTGTIVNVRKGSMFKISKVETRWFDSNPCIYADMKSVQSNLEDNAKGIASVIPKYRFSMRHEWLVDIFGPDVEEELTRLENATVLEGDQNDLSALERTQHPRFGIYE